MQEARGRLAAEVGFIILVALGAGLAELGVAMIVVLIGLSWLLVAFVEWTAWRGAAERAGSDPAVAVEAPPDATASPESERLQQSAAPKADGTQPAGTVETSPVSSRTAAAPQAPADVTAEAPAAATDVPPATASRPDENAAAAASPDTERRQWNIWYLERVLRERAGADVARDEERSALLMYLREFASADGALPADFDDLVRESFDELIDAAPRA